MVKPRYFMNLKAFRPYSRELPEVDFWMWWSLEVCFWYILHPNILFLRFAFSICTHSNMLFRNIALGLLLTSLSVQLQTLNDELARNVERFHDHLQILKEVLPMKNDTDKIASLRQMLREKGKTTGIESLASIFPEIIQANEVVQVTVTVTSVVVPTTSVHHTDNFDLLEKIVEKMVGKFMDPYRMQNDVLPWALVTTASVTTLNFQNPSSLTVPDIEETTQSGPDLAETSFSTDLNFHTDAPDHKSSLAESSTSSSTEASYSSSAEAEREAETIGLLEMTSFEVDIPDIDAGVVSSNPPKPRHRVNYVLNMKNPSNKISVNPQFRFHDSDPKIAHSGIYGKPKVAWNEHLKKVKVKPLPNKATEFAELERLPNEELLDYFRRVFPSVEKVLKQEAPTRIDANKLLHAPASIQREVHAQTKTQPATTKAPSQALVSATKGKISPNRTPRVLPKDIPRATFYEQVPDWHRHKIHRHRKHHNGSHESIMDNLAIAHEGYSSMIGVVIFAFFITIL